MGNGRVFHWFAQKASSRIVYISWLNKFSLKGQIGSTCMRPLASEITFDKKKIYHVQKQLLYLLGLNFERILHNTEYVLRCSKTVWNLLFSKSGNFGSLRLLSRNLESQL